MLPVYFICSTLNTVLFVQAPPKPYQTHHLDPISLLIDGSGLLKLKPGSGIGEKTRIHPDPQHCNFVPIFLCKNYLDMFV